MAFSAEIRSKVLLWCDRHCCLCGKSCGPNIEVHHIIPGGPDSLDNAIPLCFDCHGQVQHYNDSHPRGSKFRPREIKTRREQIYEKFTRHLVPSIHYEVTQQLEGGRTRQLPDVGFNLAHQGSGLPVRVRAVLEQVRGRAATRVRGHLGGSRIIHLNPRLELHDHFRLPHPRARTFRIRVSLLIYDELGRPHSHLPIHYRFNRRKNYWYLEPY